MQQQFLALDIIGTHRGAVLVSILEEGWVGEDKRVKIEKKRVVGVFGRRARPSAAKTIM